MLDYGINIAGERNLTRNLDQMPGIVREILREKMEIVADMMLGDLIADVEAKNIGESTGELAASAEAYVTETGNSIQLIVGFNGSVDYARIQDKGGVIPAHIIYPREAKVLRWIGPDGKRRFARRVFHPGGVIPAKNYLKDLKREYAPRIAREIKVGIVQGLRARMRGTA